MNNKKVSCVAKNNDINDPKTRTVTIQMNRKFNVKLELESENKIDDIFSSATSKCWNSPERELSYRGAKSSYCVRGRVQLFYQFRNKR